jgi:LPS-assembly protein
MVDFIMMHNVIQNPQKQFFSQLKSDLKLATTISIILLSTAAVAQADFSEAQAEEVKEETKTTATEVPSVPEEKTEAAEEVVGPEEVSLEETLEESAEDLEESAEELVDEIPKDILEQAVIEADSLTYDKETKILTAEGNVILGYKNREMRASKIVYDQNTKMINADDKVEFTDESGTVFTADNFEVNDVFDKGEMKNVVAVMKDGSKFESESLTILAASKYDLTDSTYSPCKPCEDGTHLWQFDADKIIYDETTGRVTYRDTYLKVFGKKVGWVPMISHPTPFAKSKSGFLTPTFGQSSDYGAFAKVPYYYQPKQNMDFTFEPLLTQQDGPILINEFRHLIEKGEYKFKFSGAYPKELDDSGNQLVNGDSEFRGHIEGIGNFEYAENWDYGFDFARATDDTYLRRYDIGTYEDVLKSELFANRIVGRDYLTVKALSFQGLAATDDPAISPIVLPVINGGKTYEVSDKYNQRVETDFNTMLLKRDVGADSSRVIGGAKWKGDYTSTGGHIFNFSAGSRADYYDVNKVSVLGTDYNGSENRMIPTASLTWSFPLQKVGSGYGLVIEPISMAVVSPNGSNTLRIPNEDSQNIELSDYNLFQENHISGYDLVEDGFRMNYGVRGVLTTTSLGDFNFLAGQNYRATTDDTVFDATSGMDDNYSDYVGRVSTGSEKIQTSYRFRINKDDFSFDRNEVGVNLSLEDVQLATGYSFIEGLAPLPDRQEVYTSGRLKLNDSFSLLANTRRNLDNSADAGWINVGSGVEFTNDCLTSSFEVNRDFTRDRDIEPETQFIFRLTLANFGS